MANGEIRLRDQSQLIRDPMSLPSSTTYHYLARRPESAYRQLFVRGARIRADVLYGHYTGEEPRSPEQIAADYDLPVEAVREAIAYCESEPAEIREDRLREAATAEAAGMNLPDYKLHGKPKLLSPQELARLRAP
ncbi:MAG: DUF433 domain-containing protein [Planctomycetes bacterium]|nr:DUF433 domain-containing protein [Planctomycetota bacterium]